MVANLEKQKVYWKKCVCLNTRIAKQNGQKYWSHEKETNI